MQTELTVWTKKVNMATMCRTSEETDILCRSIERCVSWLFIRKKGAGGCGFDAEEEVRHSIASALRFDMV